MVVVFTVLKKDAVLFEVEISLEEYLGGYDETAFESELFDGGVDFDEVRVFFTKKS